MNFQKPECPILYFTTNFFKELIQYFLQQEIDIPYGAHWVWFIEQFPELKEKVEEYFENATTGDPSLAAYYMVKYCDSSTTWAEKIIENATIGDPSWAAYCMADDGGSSKEWAERVIENAKIGNPSYAAYRMVIDCGSSATWRNRQE